MTSWSNCPLFPFTADLAREPIWTTERARIVQNTIFLLKLHLEYTITFVFCITVQFVCLYGPFLYSNWISVFFYAYWGRYPRKPVFGRKFPWGLLCPYVFFIIRFFCSSIFLSLTSYMFLVFTRVAFYISLTCFQVCDVFDFKSDELAGTMGTGSCDWTRKGPRD